MRFILRLLNWIVNHFKRIYSSIKFHEYANDSVFIGYQSVVKGDVKIGRGTNINSAYIHGVGEGVEIGKYCAIANDVVIRTGTHNYNYANLQGRLAKKIKTQVGISGVSGGKVKIGNNVWIGDRVIILPGITVGDGAIIGAGSIVTKDVAGFSIAVGCPAKQIRSRFSEPVVDFFEITRWWDWSDAKIVKNKQFFEIDFSTISPEELSDIVIVD